MANFNSFKITDGGLDLQYKAQMGNAIRFTKFKLGDGYYAGSIRELNELVSPIMDEPITRLSITGEGTKKKLIIGFDLDNKNITEGFYLREIGIYALDPDTNEDVLMFYTNSGDTADYIASNNSDDVMTKLINGEIYISDIDNITATIDSSLIYATQTDIQTLNNSINALSIKIDNIEIPTKVSDLQNDVGFATETQVETKVDKINGKGLSSNDFTDDDKQKLNSLPVNSNIVNGSAEGSLRTIGSKVEDDTYTIGTYSFAEGKDSKAIGGYSHAEGNTAIAKGNSSHAEGSNTNANGTASHTEGRKTNANGNRSHAEGDATTAGGEASHAEGANTTASGDYSHAEGSGTKAAGSTSHVQGKYNIEDTASIYADIIGNGTSAKRSNAATVDWQGNAWFARDVFVGSTSGTNKDDGSERLAHINEVPNITVSNVDIGTNANLSSGKFYAVYE